MLRSSLSQPRLDAEGVAALETRWRAFAARADASFFQDWTWIGCLAAERFRDPVLLETFEDDQLIGLALFNRRLARLGGDALYLHESDDPVLNSIYTEHNGPLLALPQGGSRNTALAALLQAAMFDPVADEPPRARRIVLSGVGPDCAAAASGAGGVLTQQSTRLAPFINFRGIPPSEEFLGRVSRNTRHQLRRSNRLYESHGPLTLDRADTVEMAHAYLNKLVLLHDLTWNARGKPGAFATEPVRRFHRALIARGVPRGEVDLLRITAGPVLIGYLMNFKYKGVVSAYQSGFNYSVVGQHLKPGLTSHYLAIEHYRAAGAVIYDFLAGADRYKLSLANAERWLHWLTVSPRWHPAALVGRLRAALPI